MEGYSSRFGDMKSHFVLTSAFVFALMSSCALGAAQQTSSATQPSSGTASQDSKPAEPSAQSNSRSSNTSTPTQSKKKKKSKHKAVPKKTADTGPRRVVVRGGSTADSGGTLSRGLSNDEAAHQREKTAQLLQSTDANLKSMSGRQLTANQQDAVRQINSYMEQSKTATQDGDLQRARNLAEKARLLSDALSHQ
jgi:hypothetical protein